jgi:hypothetical protein
MLKARNRPEVVIREAERLRALMSLSGHSLADAAKGSVQ